MELELRLAAAITQTRTCSGKFLALAFWHWLQRVMECGHLVARQRVLQFIASDDEAGLTAWLEGVVREPTAQIRAGWFADSLQAGEPKFARAACRVMPVLRFRREDDSTSVFCEASRTACCDLVDELAVQCDAESRWTRERDFYGRTPMLLACLANQPYNLAMIAQFPAAWEACYVSCDQPWFPVHAVVTASDGTCALLLMKAAMKLFGSFTELLSTPSYFKQLPVMLAVKHGSPALSFLMQPALRHLWPAWAVAVDADGNTLRDHARSAGCTDVLALLDSLVA